MISCSVDTEVKVEDGISDHKLIVIHFPNLSLAKINTKNSHTFIKDYSRANDESIIDYLEIKLDDFYAEPSDDVENLWLKFKAAIFHCEKTYIPTKHKQTKRRNPWITRELIHMQRRLKRIWKRKSNPAVINQYYHEFKSLLHQARNNFFSHILTDFMTTQPKKFSRYRANAGQSNP